MTSNRGIVPLQTRLLGRLQFWLFEYGQWRLGNGVSALRYWLWRATGGRHDI